MKEDTKITMLLKQRTDAKGVLSPKLLMQGVAMTE